MDRRYSILAILLIVAALGLILMKGRSLDKEVAPEKLLNMVNDQSRFLSIDQVTERIIAGDPTLQLIDVRNPENFRKWALPGAINIPLDSLMNPAWKEILLQSGKEKVFYSNADIEADAAWQMAARKGIPGIYVMQGGLNQWFKLIIVGEKPSLTASATEIDRYNFHVAARQYFTGQSPVGMETETKPVAKKAPVKVNVVKKEPAASSGGGC